MAKAAIEITGFKELERKIKELPDRVKRREVLKVLNQVARSTEKAARLTAPKSKKPHLISGKRSRRVVIPGNLKKSIGRIRGKRGSAKVNAVIYVGPRSKGRKNDGFYGAFVHGGTRSIKPNRFMERAYKQTKGKVTAEMEEKVARYIRKQIDRLSR